MSIWHEIKKQEDVELSEDGKTLEILYKHDHNGNKYIEIPVEFIKCALGNDEYEPYFGWCDVDGCKNEGCSGGNAWRDTGYWTVCYKHSDDYRKGLNQPKMNQYSVEREKKRDPITGYLS